MPKTIGIDLGTTNSVVAVMEGNEPVVIPNSEGLYTTPSVVAFQKDNKRVVGAVAKRQAVQNPENTVYSIKRFMGRRYDEVPEEIRIVPYTVIKASNGDARIEIKGKEYSPPEISAMVLTKMRETAEDYLGERVTDAVVTVPAYFNDSQRQATKDAGKIAGLQVKRILNEPTAAALAYGIDKKKEEKIAVFDFGGGTFDISILEIGDEGVFKVESTNGDTHLGGDNIDDLIVHWLADEFRGTTGIDLLNDKMALQRLRDEAERAKKDLSTLTETAINLMYISSDAEGARHLQTTLTRAKFEELIHDIVERLVGPCKAAIKDAGVTPGEIDEVILVGGSTRIPMVQQKVKQVFGKEPNRTVNPDLVVGMGAAIQGGIMTGEVTDILLLDVTPLSLGIETLGGVSTRIIERNTTIPAKRQQIFTTADNNQTTVEIHVLQGEREMARFNRTIGRFHLVGIPSAPRGVPQVEVTFDIDANGILKVSAKDLATSKEQNITITADSGLSDSEIDEMVDDAKEHADEDKKLREEADLRNRADASIAQAEKLLEELAEQATDEEKNKVKAAADRLKVGKESDDIDEIRSASEGLDEAINEMTTRLYQQAGEAYQQEHGDQGGFDPGAETGDQPPGDAGAEPQTDDEGVVDADYEIVEDEEE